MNTTGETPLYADDGRGSSAVEGIAQSGCDGCEGPEKCCGCLPIKSGMLLTTAGAWMSFLVYVKYIQEYALIQDNYTKYEEVGKYLIR